MNEYDEITVKNENPLLKILKWTLTVILIILLAILIIFLIKGYSNNNKLTIKTKEEFPQQKKEDDINFSKILNDTEGFDNCKY